MNELTRQSLIDLANAKMYYGKYEGRYLVQLPEAYLVWYKNKGFSKGKHGEQLAMMLEIKMNGLEELIWTLVRK